MTFGLHTSCEAEKCRSSHDAASEAEEAVDITVQAALAVVRVRSRDAAIAQRQGVGDFRARSAEGVLATKIASQSPGLP